MPFWHIVKGQEEAMMSAADHVRAALAALERMETGDQLAAYYHPDVAQIELPNQLVPTGATRDRAALLEGAARGRAIMARQSYEVQRIFEVGYTVIAEVKWTGVLSVPLGRLAAGDAMVAHFACFFELRDGLIWRQRNYDCFEPF